MERKLPVYPLSHPRVIATREEFYRNRRTHTTTRCRVTFEFLYEKFSSTNPDFEMIQEKAGVNHHSLDRLHDTYFMDLLRVANAGERRRNGHKQCREEFLDNQRRNLPELPCFARITEGATRVGHQVEAKLLLNDRGWFSGICRKRVVVSGTICWIHPIRKTKQVLPGRTQRIARTMLTRPMLDTTSIQLYPILIPQCTPQTLVIPSAELSARFFPEDCTMDQKDLSIPIYNRSRQRSTSFDFWSFADRWDLIPRAA